MPGQHFGGVVVTDQQHVLDDLLQRNRADGTHLSGIGGGIITDRPGLTTMPRLASMSTKVVAAAMAGSSARSLRPGLILPPSRASADTGPTTPEGT